MPTQSTQKQAFAVMWERALEAKNTQALENLVKAKVYQKPREPVYKKNATTSAEQVARSNRMKAWLRKKTAWQNGMNRAERMVMEARMDVNALQKSKDPGVVSFALKRGNVRALEPRWIQKRVKALQSAVPPAVDAHLIVLTALVDHGVDVLQYAKLSTIQSPLSVFVENIFDSIEVNRGVRAGHITLLQALQRRGHDMSVVFADVLEDARMNISWDQFMQLVRKLKPSDPAAEAAYMRRILVAVLANDPKADEVRDLARLMHLDASVLEKGLASYLPWMTNRSLNYYTRRQLVHMLEVTAPHFQRDRVRLSWAALQKLFTTYHVPPNHGEVIIHELQSHALLGPRPASRPASRNASPAPKRRRRNNSG
jgi:hypothetical protein